MSVAEIDTRAQIVARLESAEPAIDEQHRTDVEALFEQVCDRERSELVAAAHSALELVPGPLRRTVFRVVGL